MKTANQNITLRPATDEDREFLYEVYCSTRHSEVAQFGWDEVQNSAFLRMQFDMRERAYRMQSPAAEYSIIMFGTEHAGSMITESTDEKIVLIDIAVLPQYKRNGIAKHLIRQLQNVAAALGRPVVLHVDKLNSNALKLYKTLGFIISADNELMYEMEWQNDR
ncbi:MAG: GNAT family N-acetyltransferase [Pyrinomonadaceae bacterium]